MKRQRLVFLFLILIVASCQVQDNVKPISQSGTKEGFIHQFQEKTLTMSKVANDLQEGRLPDANKKLKQLMMETEQIKVTTYGNLYLMDIYGNQTTELICVALEKYQDVIDGLYEALNSPDAHNISESQWNQIGSALLSLIKRMS